jgi:hypothetical protein
LDDYGRLHGPRAVLAFVLVRTINAMDIAISYESAQCSPLVCHKF